MEGDSVAGVPAPVVARRRNRERLAWGVAGSAVVSAIVLGFVSLRPPPSDVPAARFILQAPEGAILADGEATGGAAISPDGHHLAFVASHAKSGATAQPLLWVRALDSLSAQPFNGTAGAAFPFWSPDSRFIGFFAQGKLKKIDAAGRSVQTICDAPRGYGASAWNREGMILFSPAYNAPVNRVPAAGGAPTPATVLDTSRKESSHRWVQFLPDGRHFLYTALVDTAITGVHSEDNALYVASLDSGKLAGSGSRDRKRLLSTDYMGAYAPSAHGGTGHLLFWHSNSLMAQPFDPQKLELTGEPIPIADQGGRPEIGTTFSRPFSLSENGVIAYSSNVPSLEKHQMVWYDRAGKRLGTVGEPGISGVLKLSPDQKQLAVDRLDRWEGTGSNVAVLVFDLIRNTTSRLTFHPGVSGFPIWSPDGSRIVFTSNWEGSFNLYQKPASGVGSEEQILKARSAWPTDWSRDGHFIVYDDRSDTTTVWVLPLEGDRKPFPFEQYAWQAAFSPDGRWLAYASDESGKNEVYVRPFTGKPGAAPSGGKFLISTTSGSAPKWRRDGKELFYVTHDGKLMAVEIKSGANFESGAPKLLFDTHVPDAAYDGTAYDVTADGQRFIVLTPLEQAPVRSPITVVLNWQAGLKK
jgi:Tol biopolymer transport system component